MMEILVKFEKIDNQRAQKTFIEKLTKILLIPILDNFATLDSRKNIGIRIKFEELKKIRARNFPEFGEINILFLKKIRETYLEIRLKNSYFKKTVSSI